MILSCLITGKISIGSKHHDDMRRMVLNGVVSDGISVVSDAEVMRVMPRPHAQSGYFGYNRLAGVIRNYATHTLATAP